MRVTDRRGVSWPDPAHPGVRHWASRSISYPLPFWLVPFWWLLLFYLGVIWLGLEVYIIVISGLWVGLNWLAYPATRFHVKPGWAWYFFYLRTGDENHEGRHRRAAALDGRR